MPRIDAIHDAGFARGEKCIPVRLSQTVLAELDRQIAVVSAQGLTPMSRPYYLRRLMHAIPLAPEGGGAKGIVPFSVRNDVRILRHHCGQGTEHPSEELWVPLMQCLVTVSDRIVHGLVQYADTIRTEPSHASERKAIDSHGGLANTECREFDKSEPMIHRIVVNVSAVFFDHMKTVAKSYGGGSGSKGVLSDLIRRALMGHPMPSVRSPEAEERDHAALADIVATLFLIKELLVMQHPVEHADMIAQRLLATQHSIMRIRGHIANIAPLTLEDRPSVILQAAQ